MSVRAETNIRPIIALAIIHGGPNQDLETLLSSLKKEVFLTQLNMRGAIMYHRH